jgi:hypothetical protein
MPNVEVRDADGNLLHVYEIFVEEYGTLITDEHLFDMARMNAIDDGLISNDQADKLIITLAT